MGATCGQKRLFGARCWLKSVSIRVNRRRNHCLCDSQRPPRSIAHTKPRRSEPGLRPQPRLPHAKHAKSAKTTNKQNKNGFSLGALCVFARDIILLVAKTCSLPSELSGEDFELLRVCRTEGGIPEYDLVFVALCLRVSWLLVPAGGRAAFIRVHRPSRPSWLRGGRAWYVPCGLGAGSGGKFPRFPDFLATVNAGARLIYRERFVLSCVENSPHRHRDHGDKLGRTKPIRCAGLARETKPIWGPPSGSLGHSAQDKPNSARDRCAKQSQSPGWARPEATPVRSGDRLAARCAKQSQFRGLAVRKAGVIMRNKPDSGRGPWDCGVRIGRRRNKAGLVCGACPRNKANLGPARRESGVHDAKQTQFSTRPVSETKPIVAGSAPVHSLSLGHCSSSQICKNCVPAGANAVFGCAWRDSNPQPSAP